MMAGTGSAVCVGMVEKQHTISLMINPYTFLELDCLKKNLILPNVTLVMAISVKNA